MKDGYGWQQHHDGQIQVWRHRGDRLLNSCVIHRHTWYYGMGRYWISLSHSSSTHCRAWPQAYFNSHILQHVARIVQRFFVNHQIELLPWPARSPNLSPIENMWPMVAQQLTQITTPAATPDQLRQRVEAAWSSVPQEHIQSL
ncbi:transposable element Tcb1 transposase [Trichonephila clavipes]|uniref:Transposable element Tcb1 transposase n=1 Tax=Trichonephila clavipes TaxID=2585209 RepID=A0A8X6T5Z2_TRICX|nr:transposable element Tcb1 transposase [Trichonephila clavipes]